MKKISLKFILLTVFLISLFTVMPTSAQTNIINFENLFQNQPLSNQYSGLIFSDGNPVIYDVNYPQLQYYPPHSGTKGVRLYSNTCRVSFTTPVSRVKIWYISLYQTPQLIAFDANNNRIGDVNGISSYNPSSLEISGSEIKSVVIVGYNMAFDDLEYDVPDTPSTPDDPSTPDSSSIPEFPSIVLPIAAILGIMFISQRRKE